MATNNTEDYVFDNSIFEEYVGNATDSEYGEKGPSEFLQYLMAEDEETNNEWKIIDINHAKELQAEEYDNAKRVFALISTGLILGVACSLLADRDFTTAIVSEIKNYSDIESIKNIVLAMPLNTKILMAGTAASLAGQIKSGINAKKLRSEITPISSGSTAVNILEINKAIEEGLTESTKPRRRES